MVLEFRFLGGQSVCIMDLVFLRKNVNLSLLLYCNEFSKNSINNLFYGRLFECCHCEKYFEKKLGILPGIRRKKIRFNRILF